MPMKVYNTLSRKKEEFVPLEKGKVGIYTCGPTVYNYAHIGNFRSYVFEDLLIRFLRYKGLKVTQVMNITDIDDKTIRDSKKEGKSLKEFTDFYTREFLKDLDTLNISKPDIMPRATEHIKEMVAMVKNLEKNKHTYQKGGSTYFSIRTMPNYGELARIDLAGLQDSASGRVDDDSYEKEDAKDFALWKGYDESDGDVFWETELGKGRPGWHIECSAMSTKYLGDSFDIHCGGVDLIFPHHSNEIAQAEGATGKKFVKYWMHCRHLIVEGQKMSKSLGNFYTVRDLLKKGYSAKAIRYVLLATHYRQELNFTFDSLKGAENNIEKFREFLVKLKAVKGKAEGDVDKSIKAARQKFESSLDDDLNISGAMAAVFEFMGDVNSMMGDGILSGEGAKKALDFMMELDKVFGLMDFDEAKVPDEIQALVDKREAARKAKDWATSDRLRDDIKEKGWAVSDSKDGPIVKKL